MTPKQKHRQKIRLAFANDLVIVRTTPPAPKPQPQPKPNEQIAR